MQYIDIILFNTMARKTLPSGRSRIDSEKQQDEIPINDDGGMTTIVVTRKPSEAPRRRSFCLCVSLLSTHLFFVVSQNDHVNKNRYYSEPQPANDKNQQQRQ